MASVQKDMAKLFKDIYDGFKIVDWTVDSPPPMYTMESIDPIPALGPSILRLVLEGAPKTNVRPESTTMKHRLGELGIVVERVESSSPRHYRVELMAHYTDGRLDEKAVDVLNGMLPGSKPFQDKYPETISPETSENVQKMVEAIDALGELRPERPLVVEDEWKTKLQQAMRDEYGE